MRRNLWSEPVEVDGRQFRAVTSYHYFGGVSYQGGIQQYEGPGDRWGIGPSCRHNHRSAEAALACAQRRLDRMASR